MRRPLAIVLAGVVLAGLLVWLGRSPDALAPLAHLSWTSLGALLLVSAVALAVQGVQFGVLVWLFGVRLPAVEWLGLTCVNNLLAYALPVRGGTLVRAAYLQQVRALPLHAYAALTISSHVVMACLVCLAGMLLALGLRATGTALPPWLLAAFVAAPVVAVVGAALLAALGEWIARVFVRLGAHARAFRASLGTWRRRPARAAVFVGVTVGMFVLHGLRLLVALRAVGLALPWPVVFLVHAAAAASAVVAVTPANLGTREAVMGMLGASLGFDPRTVVLAALVERAVVGLEAATGSLLLGRSLQRRLQRSSP